MLKILNNFSFQNSVKNAFLGVIKEHCKKTSILYLTLVLLNPDMSCLCKQCRSRSVGFWRSQLIWICTVCHSECEIMSTIWIKKSDWLKIWKGCGILIYSAGQGFMLNMLGKIFSIWHIEIFFIFFPENRFWHFMHIVSNGDNLHEISNPVFWGKIRKILSICCLLISQRVVKINYRNIHCICEGILIICMIPFPSAYKIWFLILPYLH